jgi:hypothetical protein
MVQILPGSATTTHAVRAAIQRSKAPLKDLAAQYGLNHKTVAKWRKRAFVHDAAMGPRTPRSTVLSAEEEALVIAFRKHTLLALDDCLYPPAARGTPRRLLGRYNFAKAAQDPPRAHALRTHLRRVGRRSALLPIRSNPSHFATENLISVHLNSFTCIPT